MEKMIMAKNTIFEMLSLLKIDALYGDPTTKPLKSIIMEKIIMAKNMIIGNFGMVRRDVVYGKRDAKTLKIRLPLLLY